jgi:hypothetical protein
MCDWRAAVSRHIALILFYSGWKGWERTTGEIREGGTSRRGMKVRKKGVVMSIKQK